MSKYHEILNVDSSASKDELKKAYRKAAAKYHPDNKETGDAEKFKEIQKAYDILTKKKEINNNQYKRNLLIKFPPLQIKVNLTFKESVLGCKKELSFSRYTRCDSCNASGGYFTEEECKICKGKGGEVKTFGNMQVIQQCQACAGSGSHVENCSICSGNGCIISETSGNVDIPGGMTNDKVIRLPGAGHYESSPFGEGYTEVFINLDIEKEENMILEGSDVISTLDITLLEALEGTDKEVNTIYGKNNLKILPRMKNKDKVSIPKFGAKNNNITGDHIFILNVNYPENLNDLISALKGK